MSTIVDITKQEVRVQFLQKKRSKSSIENKKQGYIMNEIIFLGFGSNYTRPSGYERVSFVSTVIFCAFIIYL